MKTSINSLELLKFYLSQLNNHFFDGDEIKVSNEIIKQFDFALQRVEFCFSKINNKYYFSNNTVRFNHLNSDHNAVLLYYWSNTLYNNNYDRKICDKIFYLNKILHGLDAYYEVKLPDIFLLVHPLGTVLGRGEYSNYFVAYQRCGIGSNKDKSPSLGEHVTLRPGASVLGNSIIGDYCEIAADSLLLDKKLEEESLYIGNPKSNFIAKSKRKNQNWF